MTLWDTSKGVSGGFLYSADSYLDLNAQTTGDFKSQVSGSLGTITKSCKQDDEEKRLWMEKKKQKQDIARSLIGGRLEVCGIIPVPVNQNGEMVSLPDELRNIQIMQNEENFSFGGLMRCGSVWSCPDCASIIAEFRRRELQEAITAALSLGLTVSMLTLTIPHYSKDILSNLLGDSKTGIQGALRIMKNRKAWKDLMKEIGLVGNIRALEVTHGCNGWHPHYHILLFTKQNIDEKLDELKKVLLTQWQAACVSSGLPCPNEHGLDLVNGTWAASYCAKWGVPEEMTKGHLKNGVKEGHVSPFGLLDLYANGDQKAGKRYQEYVKVFKGRRQLVWSKGLRDMLKVQKQISDEKVIEEVEKKSQVFMTISYEDYKKILKHGKQVECLSLCRQGKEAVRAWLRGLDDLDLTFPTIQ